jgi:hypothetical protein
MKQMGVLQRRPKASERVRPSRRIPDSHPLIVTRGDEILSVIRPRQTVDRAIVRFAVEARSCATATALTIEAN